MGDRDRLGGARNAKISPLKEFLSRPGEYEGTLRLSLSGVPMSS